MTKRMKIRIIDEVEFCCEKMRKYYESHNIKFDSIDSVMIYNKKAITNCPFCETFIEVDVSVAHWGGE